MLVIKILIKGIFLAMEYSAVFFLNPVEVWLEENKQTKKLHIKVMILTSVKTSGDELTWLIVLIICWICIYSLINQTETTWLWLQLQPRQEVPLAQSQDGALNAVGSQLRLILFLQKRGVHALGSLDRLMWVIIKVLPLS